MVSSRVGCVARLGFVLAALAVAPIHAQESPANSTGIGLVDVSEILLKHEPFVKTMERIREDASEAEGRFSVLQQDFQTDVGKLQAMKPGTPDADKLRRRLEKTQIELKAAIEKEMADFRQRELRTNVRFNKQIREAVKLVAKAKGLKFVFNHSKLSLDSDNPQEQVQAVNQPVLYEEGLDVTADVLAELAKLPPDKEPAAPAKSKEPADVDEVPAPKTEKKEPKK